jgi:hypothetical protein
MLLIVVVEEGSLVVMLVVVEVASPVFAEVESMFPKKTDADISSSGGFACNASRIRVTVAEGGLV